MNAPRWVTHEPYTGSPARTRTVHDAIISPFEIDRVDERIRHSRGAVYDADGQLIPASVRYESPDGIVFSRAPQQLPTGPIDNWPRLEGTWLFGGHFMRQFGHFITESLTSVWPLGVFDGIVTLPFIFGGRMDDWHRKLYQLVQPELPVRVVGQGCTVQHLVVPDRSVEINRAVREEAVHTWWRAAAHRDDCTKVFFSRSHLTDDRRAIPGDEEIDELAADLGFEVVHPQELDITEQLAIVGSASHILGLAGSALHLSAFAKPGTRVIEIGDRRSPQKQIAMQATIDGALRHRSAFIPLKMKADSRRLDLLEDDLRNLLLHR